VVGSDSGVGLDRQFREPLRDSASGGGIDLVN